MRAIASTPPVLMLLWFFCSDSVEREETMMDNSVQLQSFVQYEPDLFVSRCVVVCSVQHRRSAIY